MPKLFVISLGGSLVVPNEIEVEFLKDFSKFIINQSKKGNRFILTIGGGRPARVYQEALKKSEKTKAYDLDEIGIAATRFNAGLVKLFFGKRAHKEVLTNFEKRLSIKEPVILTGGWKPGRSSDGAAVRLAELYKASALINLSNIDYVYTKDPRKFKSAEKIEHITWREFRKIVGDKWKPGANLPFDPTAAKLAEKIQLKVIIANGKNLQNLQNILEEKKFVGTQIK